MSEIVADLFVTNTDTKSVIFTPELLDAVPRMYKAHVDANKAFDADPDSRLDDMAEGHFTFQSSNGEQVHASVETPRSSSNLDEAVVVFAPFADCYPHSNAADLKGFLNGSKHGFATKEFKAQPHTWSQATKSAVLFDLLDQLDEALPVITIYSPIPTAAYSADERKAQRGGDFTPAARIAREAVAKAQDRIHGPHATTKITKLHIDGASLGASNAVGAAHGLLSDHDIQSVTARELILGIDSVPSLAARFMVKTLVGEPSDVTVSRGETEVGEASLREHVDAYGIEPLGMISRSLGAMLKRTYMVGLTRSEATRTSLRALEAANVSTLLASGANSSMSEFTFDNLLSGIATTQVVAERGQRIGHIMNEFAALSASITAYQIYKTRNS